MQLFFPVSPFLLQFCLWCFIHMNSFYLDRVDLSHVLLHLLDAKLCYTERSCVVMWVCCEVHSETAAVLRLSSFYRWRNRRSDSLETDPWWPIWAYWTQAMNLAHIFLCQLFKLSFLFLECDHSVFPFSGELLDSSGLLVSPGLSLKPVIGRVTLNPIDGSSFTFICLEDMMQAI